MADNVEIDLYLKVREKEGRLYSDDVVAQLPVFPKNHALSSEWQVRFSSALRLKGYLSKRHTSLKILDLGCGNGWLSNFLYQAGHTVLGIDQNYFELKQATRVFSSNSNLSFLEADIFFAPFPKESFDMILLASAVQYFPDLNILIKNLLQYLKLNGEIHIIDTPFYSDSESDNAIHRSQKYYLALGFPEMSKHYFHHRISDLEQFSTKWLYRPSQFVLRTKKLFGKMDSPFPWVVVKS